MSRCINKPWNYNLNNGKFRSHFGDEIPYLWKVNLRDLWTCKPSDFPGCPEDNIIYCIHNDKNGKCYIGQAHNLFERFTTSYTSHLESYINGIQYSIYNSINKYKSKSFTVYILNEFNSDSDLNKYEKYWINILNTYIHNDNSWGYNMTKGGEDCSQMHTEIANIHRRKSLQLAFPNTNGASESFINAGHIRTKELYPDTNGMPTECLEAGFQARVNKYGLNGMTWNCINAGLDKLKELYPDTNGASPQFIAAGNKVKVKNTIINGYNNLIKMCNKFRSNGGSKWTKTLYNEYKLYGTPQPLAYRMRKFFENCSKFNLDVTNIIDLFPDNWIHE